MNSQFYDNNANNIEYFNLHKPKVEVKRKELFDFKNASNDEVLQKIEECQIKYDDLLVFYNDTKHETTFVQISKLRAFISMMRGELKNRNVQPNFVLENQIAELKRKNADLLKHKDIAHGKGLCQQIEQLKNIIAENREAEKTKRHMANIENDKYKYQYLKEYIIHLVDENEYKTILEDLEAI